jgi:hypothetical protein
LIAWAISARPLRIAAASLVRGHGWVKKQPTKVSAMKLAKMNFTCRAQTSDSLNIRFPPICLGDSSAANRVKNW